MASPRGLRRLGSRRPRGPSRPATFLPEMARVQLKTFTLVGTPISMVAAEKKIFELLSNDMVNMWWAHTKKPNHPIDNVLNTMPRAPNNFILLACSAKWLMIPNTGIIII